MEVTCDRISYKLISSSDTEVQVKATHLDPLPWDAHVATIWPTAGFLYEWTDVEVPKGPALGGGGRIQEVIWVAKVTGPNPSLKLLRCGATLSLKFKGEDFAGDWGGNGTKILISGGKVTVKWGPGINRPDGTGVVNPDGTITVNFPDDKSYTGTLVSANQINWGGNNNWTRS